jgi:hypothetical protein
MCSIIKTDPVASENYLPNKAIVKQLSKCQFTAIYYDYESQAIVDYNCERKDEDILPSGLCIFHDESYLKEDKDNRKEPEQKVRDSLMVKVRDSVDQKEALFCIGYQLPDNTIKQNFTKPVYFRNCKFEGRADFSRVNFQAQADFFEI